MRILTLKSKSAGLFGFGLILILSFQNCANQNFTAQSPAATQKAADGASNSGLDDDSSNTSSSSGGDSPSPTAGNGSDQRQNEISNAKKKCDEAKASHKGTALASGSSYDNALGFANIEGGGLGNVSNFAGFTLARASSLKTVKNTAGFVLIYNDGLGSGTIDVIDSKAGAVITCGFSVGAVKSGEGSVIVIDGDVGQVTNRIGFTGVGNGDVQDVDNFAGAVVVLHGNILGNRKNVAGAVISIP